MGEKLGVGIVGLTPGRSWSAFAHVPALQALSDTFSFNAVANSSAESAQRAAAELGSLQAYGSVGEMTTADDIDIVSVTVKVPHHLALARQAIDAGKHIYCEWPLGNGLAEARELADLAKNRSIVAVAGLQATAAPAIRYAADLIAEGYVGDVISSTLVGDGGSWGPETSNAYDYILDRANGATMLTIPLGHTLAGVVEVLGPIADVLATVTTRFPLVKVVETGEMKPMTAPDQIIVSATLESGAPLAIHYRGGVSRSTGLLWEILGTKGDLRITGSQGHAQMVDLALSGAQGEGSAVAPLEIPERYLDNLPSAAVPGNVARMYADMALDIRSGTQRAPSFEDAVGIHQIIDAIEASAASGVRVRPDSR